MKFEYVIIAILALIVGYMIAKAIDRRNSNIIKLLIQRDLLPEPAADTKWIQRGICYMRDGSTGKVNGNYCEHISPL